MEKNKLKQILKESFVNEMQLFHGSPNNFDNFKLVYCGTNLSPQYGHGIYLTTSKDLAYNYINPEDTSYMYYVEIPDNNGENYIGYDKPLTNNQFMEIIMDLTDEEYNELVSYGFKENAPGIVVYNALSQLMSDEEASEYLSLCGIVGMYFKDPDDNIAIDYIIYDENKITITKKETIDF